MSDETTVNPSEFAAKIDKAARRSLVDFTKKTVEGVDGEAVVLADVFDENIGKHWPSKLKKVVTRVRKEVLETLREQEINPMGFSDPFGMVVNTVGLRALEEMMITADMYDSLEELRKDSDYSDPLAEDEEGIETLEETTEDGQDESPIFTPDL